MFEGGNDGSGRGWTFIKIAPIDRFESFAGAMPKAGRAAVDAAIRGSTSCSQ